MFPTAGSTIRAELNILVEEAASVDQFFIGGEVMPSLSVDDKSGTYPKLKIAGGELLTPGSTLRARGGSYGQISRKWDTDNYDCVDRGLEEPVDDTDTKDVRRFFNLEAAAARLALRNMRLDHEIRVRDAILNTTNFGAATNSSIAYTEANIGTINFPKDLMDAVIRLTNNGVAPNTIAMSDEVFYRLRRSTKLVEFVRGSVVGEANLKINQAALASAFSDFGITRVLVGKARYNSAKKGAAYSAASVWGTTYVWVGSVNPSANTPMDGGAGFTFVWNAEGGLFVTETYRNEGIRSNVVRVRQNTTEKITDGTAGTLIATQWS